MSKRCVGCGAELSDKALFCDECGMQLPTEESEFMQSEREKIAADLERANSVGMGIKTREFEISRDYDELKELDNRAAGVNKKTGIVGLILLVLGIVVVILCFKILGLIAGIISIFVVYKILDVLLSFAFKMYNEMNKEEYEANQKEYQEKKVELEQRMKKNEKELEELKADVAYQRYSSLYYKRGVIPSAMIKALREGKANTIEEAEKFADY